MRVHALLLVSIALLVPSSDCSTDQQQSQPRQLGALKWWKRRLERLIGKAKEPIVDYDAGAPVASLMPPGQCVFDANWASAPLVKREWIAHDVALLTFGLRDPQKPLGLSTCACILARSPAPSGGGEAVVRPYTPVSTNAMLGAFQLMVKVYPEGAMSQQLAHLPVGASVEFKHIPFNVRTLLPSHMPSSPRARPCRLTRARSRLACTAGQGAVPV